MKERPILFSDEMVRAILDGRKTQTRRIVKPQPVRASLMGPSLVDGEWLWYEDEDGPRGIVCPYGIPSDRLWVREAWAPYHGVDDPVDVVDDATAARYRADDSVWTCEGSPDLPPCRLDSYALAPHHEMPGGPHRWRPSIHMPRWASRITLEVTEVRVQRLHDMTPADAMAEGLIYEDEHPEDVRRIERCPLVDGFMRLWERINGPGSWDANPWVWALTFERVQP